MDKRMMKLAVIVPATVGAIAIATALMFNVVRHFIVQDNEALVHSVAQSILPALLVNDTAQVHAVLKALEGHAGIESAELISAEGVSMASYAKEGQSLIPMSQSFELASATDDPNRLHVMAPIAFDSLILANLHIAVNLWPSYLRIMTWLGVLMMLPSVIYVLIKLFRIKIRIDRGGHHGDGGSDQGGNLFDVHQAIDTSMRDADISLEYQPIQRMSDGGVFGMEVVVCWRHPLGESRHVSPASFMELADQSGICLPFEGWLLTTACTQAADWQRRYGPLILSINITASQFHDPLFAQKVRAVCEKTQYPHQLLELEVHESVISRDPQKALTCIQRLADQGLSVTVDGFGLVQNSLDVLQISAITKVKLDPKLIKRMDRDELVWQFVETTIEQMLLHGVQVIADGLTTADQLVALQKMGCGLGQGSYFQPPLTVSGFESFLARRALELTAHSSAAVKTTHAQGSSDCVVV